VFIEQYTTREKMTKQTKPVEIDFNPEFTHALELMNESGKTLLITGRWNDWLCTL